jgi:hypothetical protein
VSPADITQAAEFRAGLARRLAEVGLIAPEQLPAQLATLPAAPSAPAGQERKAA